MSKLEEERFSQEVSSLSTKLVTAVARQSELEEQLLSYKRELDLTKNRNSKLIPIEGKFKDLTDQNDHILSENSALKARIELLTKMKDDAELECSKLRSETEELSASLFDEANKMVSQARRETHNYKIKNEKLSEELNEKDTIITNLQEQLRELKILLQNLDDQQKLQSQPPTIPSTPLIERHSSFSVESFVNSPITESLKDKLTQQQLQQYIYSPMLRAVRHDLNSFNEFKEFISVISKHYFPMDLPALKEIRYFKKILLEDIDPALRLDLAPGVSYFNRKSFLNNIVEGRAVIEPISGINETYRLNFQKDHTNDSSSHIANPNLIKTNLYSYPKDSPPVATHEPCSLCGECRDDILEHTRLYMLKVQPSTTSSNSTISTPNIIKKTNYPLCNYCLFRIRSVCEFFAKLRSIHNGVYKVTHESDYRKVYSILTTVRAKIFWSRIGIWDISDNVVELNSDDLSSSIFDLPRSNTNLNLSSSLRANNHEFNHVKYKNESTSDLNDSISQIDSINNESIAESRIPKSLSEEDIDESLIKSKDSVSNIKSEPTDFKKPSSPPKKDAKNNKLHSELDETMAMIENMNSDGFEISDTVSSVKKTSRKAPPVEVIEILSEGEEETQHTKSEKENRNSDGTSKTVTRKGSINELISKFET